MKSAGRQSGMTPIGTQGGKSMHGNREIGRRRAMRAAMSAVIAAATPLRGLRTLAGTEASIFNNSGGPFTNIASVCAVGAAYRCAYDDEAGVLDLHRRLFSGADGLSGGDFADWVRTQRGIDLARNDVVLIAGWLLARSEARICAAVAVAAST
jgi:hypothetical protein